MAGPGDPADLVARIEACRRGDPHAPVLDAEIVRALGPRRSVPSKDDAIEARLVGWETGFLKVAAVQTVEHLSGLGLGESKRRVDRLLQGEAVTIPVARADAETFRAVMRALGARVEA